MKILFFEYLFLGFVLFSLTSSCVTEEQKDPPADVEITDSKFKVKNVSGSSNAKTELEILIPEPYSMVIGLLDMGEDEDFFTLTKTIYQLAQKYKLDKWGFYFKGDREGKKFTIKSDWKSSDNSVADIRLDTPSSSEPAPQFKPYIDAGKNYNLPGRNNGKVNESKHSVSFYSQSGNLLVVPKKNYKTVFHFARDASKEEIIDLWRLVAQQTLSHDRGGKFTGAIAIHSGSKHAQTVPHFHFRIEK